MHLSAQEEYGLRCLVQVARRGHSGPVGIAEVADAEGLSSDYTAKLLRVLRQGELLNSTRGAAGGYVLARPAAEISVWQAIEILGGPLFSESLCDSHAGLKTDCVHTGGCSMRSMWTWLGGAVKDALSGISLADLLNTETAM
ncbi:MAG TPA: Rrf2 family transcriptional regulator, partial [Myxococcota bacterium]|nr:Rrf2 family transcriptional regulator [Myxococcota bacterium]